MGRSSEHLLVRTDKLHTYDSWEGHYSIYVCCPSVHLSIQCHVFKIINLKDNIVWTDGQMDRCVVF